jgi:putative endonuclease
MYYCYILYSEKLDRYYIGATSLSPEGRLEQHLSGYYQNSKFTAKAHDWILFMSIECASYAQAREIESHIKSMKSKKYIANLKQYPEIIQKFLDKYSDS